MKRFGNAMVNCSCGRERFVDKIKRGDVEKIEQVEVRYIMGIKKGEITYGKPEILGEIWDAESNYVCNTCKEDLYFEVGEDE